MVNSLGQRTLGPTRITVAETCSSQMSTATCRRQWQTTAVPAKTNHGMHTNLDTLNSVNGASNNSKGTSLGTDDHVRQLILDRHQVTACNSNMNKIKVGTWNVRTLYQAGKLENVIQEMGRLDVNIFGLCETRWTNSGSMQIDDYKIIYSGGDKHEKGVGIILDKKGPKA